MKTLFISVLFLLVSCANKVASPTTTATTVKKYVDKDGAVVIQLPNPYQQNIMDEMAKSKRFTPHTVYDNSSNFDAHAKKKQAKLIEKISGQYKIHVVKEKDTPASIAHQIYGDSNHWKFIQRWNFNILPDNNHLKKGMKLRYLPPNVLAKLKTQKPTRLPASEK